MKFSFSLILALSLSALPSLCVADVVSLSVSDGGAISATPGRTTGWDFDLTSTDSNDYIFFVASEFCTGAVTNDCSNSLGTYTDFLSAEYPLVVLGPSPYSTTASQTFDPVNMLGLGSFAVNADASVGNSVSGTLVVSYEVCDTDPNTVGCDNELYSGTAEFSDALVTVTGSTPEPATVELFSVSFLCLALRFLRRRPGRFHGAGGAEKAGSLELVVECEGAGYCL